jgi:hypothetical protein
MLFPLQKFWKPAPQGPKSPQEEGQAISGFHSRYAGGRGSAQGLLCHQAGPKDVINIDDLPEDPAGHGDSGKGASSSAPPPEQPTATSAEPTPEQYEQKVQLIRATGTPQTHPELFPTLQKVPLSQHHAEVFAMMDQVWGPANTEMQELSDLESDLKVFFAKHKNVRQVTLAPKHWVRHFFRVTCVSRCFLRYVP